MSRRLGGRWELTGALVARSAVHVGNIRDGISRELTQARDGLGRPVVPGTALAGVIRAASPEEFRDHQLWGCVPGRTAEGLDDGLGRASWVWVDDATAPPETVPEYRETGSIDRITGTAARGRLFSREVLPAGTRFAFRLAVDDPESGKYTHARRLIEWIAGLLGGPGVAVGAATSRGLGRVQLEEAELRHMDFSTKVGMIAALRGEICNETLPLTERSALPHGVVRIMIPWKPHGPIMVQVSSDADTISAYPMTAIVDGAPRLVLPGSSIKGVLRTHAERIMRTVTGKEPPDEFADQMKEDRLAPVGSLFGMAGERKDTSNQGWRGAVTAHECVSSVPLPADLWDMVRLAQPQPDTSQFPADADSDRIARARALKAINELNQKLTGLRFVATNHVAVDRWTGSAADGRLFAVLEPYATGEQSWSPIIVDVDTSRLGEHADLALTLVLLILRDLCDGWISFGHSTTRGKGSIRVAAEDIVFTASTGVSGSWSTVSGCTFAAVLDDTNLVETLLAAWPPEYATVAHKEAPEGDEA